MKNYLCINGKQIELTEEQVRELTEERALLSDIEVGDTFKVGEYEFIVLEHSANSQSTCILKDLYGGNTKFSDVDNDYAKSIIKDICNKFSKEIEDIVGDSNLILNEIDLTSCDGLKDYQKCSAKAAPLTHELYKKYVNVLEKNRPDKWWWLSTPMSTASHDWDSCVMAVSPLGDISGNNCNNGNGGVRPFCIFKSSIFVSK